MRYFNTAVRTNNQEIEENTKIRLKDYSYDSPIAAVNTYMYQRLPNGITFVMYRIEGDNVLVGFSYDEKSDKTNDVFIHIMNELKSAFGIKEFLWDPVEITMFDYLQIIEEARRRGFGHYASSVIQNAKLWIHGWNVYDWKNNHFDFQEQIISKERNKLSTLYDENFCQELLNIEEHANTTEFNGNMVHYVISARSKEACMEMAETLCSSLLKANRIQSRRIEIIVDIGPDFHKINNRIEEIIENNYGGTIVFDLTERFGYDSTDYLMVCKYIEGLLKKYKNECLFIFTYNMESPGFSYYLLPNLKKYVFPVLLREGAGDRKIAEKYLKSLIEKSEYVIVILAGYSERMESFMEINEGLRSRIPYWIDFPDYDAGELIEIFKLMIKEKGMEATDEAIKEAYYILDKKRYQDNFGNGRYVRNLMEHAIQKQSVRLLEKRDVAEKIENKELYLLTKGDISTLENGLQEERLPKTAQKELDEMIGLTKVKEIIGKAKASFKLKKLCMEKGISKDKLSLHMVFTGNPGTAKTTVARLFAEILKDEKVLSTGKFVEAGRADLVGTVVGATAQLVKRKFREAKGGVLFIDEAYSLCDGYEGGYGDEAINTIVQEMENHRDNVIVIFAGYPVQMKQFLDRNPGLSSRIAFQIPFEDYTVEELCSITKLMLAKKKMSITAEALEKMRMHYEGVAGSLDYGNGRFVRKLLEEAEMNLAERLLQMNETALSIEMLTTIEEVDIPEKKENRQEKKRTIGFVM